MKYLVIHQTSGNENETIKRIYHSHFNKYGRIFYAYLIDQEGRINHIHDELNDRKNGESLDVAVMGNFKTEKPKPEQVVALDRLIKELSKEHNFKAIIPHRDIKQYGLKGTIGYCPGLVWEALLERWSKKSQR